MNKDLLSKYHDDLLKIKKLKHILYFCFLFLFLCFTLSLSLALDSLNIYLFLSSFIFFFVLFFSFYYVLNNEDNVCGYLIRLFNFNFHTHSFPFDSVLNYGDYNIIRNYNPVMEWDADGVSGCKYFLKIHGLGKHEISEKKYLNYLYSYFDSDVLILENHELENFKNS